MRNPSIIFLLLCIVLSLPVNVLIAQDPGKRELSISVSGVSANQFGMQYKSSPNGKIFFRLGLVSAGLSYTKNNPATSSQYTASHFSANLSLEAGVEGRKSVNEQLILFAGINLVAGGTFIRENQDNPLIPIAMRSLDTYKVSPGIRLNTGILFRLKDGLFLAGELLPGIISDLNFYETRLDLNSTAYSRISSVRMDFNSSSIRLSLVYQWDK